GREQLFTSAAIADYRDIWQGFLLARDGMSIQFAYQPFAQGSARFSIPDRKRDAAPASQVNWRPSQTEDSGIRVTDWRNSQAPKLNGKPLKLEDYEISFTLALPPDRSSF